MSHGLSEDYNHKRRRENMARELRSHLSEIRDYFGVCLGHGGWGSGGSATCIPN
jgi:hypothetical protein